MSFTQNFLHWVILSSIIMSFTQNFLSLALTEEENVAWSTFSRTWRSQKKILSANGATSIQKIILGHETQKLVGTNFCNQISFLFHSQQHERKNTWFWDEEKPTFLHLCVPSLSLNGLIYSNPAKQWHHKNRHFPCGKSTHGYLSFYSITKKFSRRCRVEINYN